jgi:uncharacterized protein
VTAPQTELVRVGTAGDTFFFHAPTARFFAVDGRYDAALRAVAELGPVGPERLRAELGERLALSPEGASGLDAELRALGLVGAEAPYEPPPAPDIARVKLQVSGTCNLSCSYCYQGESSGRPPRYMTRERALETVDWLFDQNPGPVEIMFFGGEPLLNVPVIEAAGRHARARGEREGRPVALSMITNGTLLTAERAALLAELGVAVGLSIDGDPASHNKLRVFASGKGSYAQTMRAFGLLRAAGCEARALVTVSQTNNDPWRVAHHLLGEGFRSVTLTPVASDDPRVRLDEAGYERLRDGMLRLADHYADRAARGERFGFSNVDGDVLAVRKGVRKHYPCAAGLTTAACSPEGELYLCHRFEGRPEHRIGSVSAGLDGAALAAFREKMHLRERTDCNACWARHLCGGGCHQHNELDNGDLRRATAARCDYLRAWYYKVLEVYARITRENPGFWG